MTSTNYAVRLQEKKKEVLKDTDAQAPYDQTP